MKKLIAVLVSCLVSASVWAASTCESRVDKSVHKSTTERVQRCLDFDQTDMPEIEEEAEVIMSDTYSVKFPKKKQPTQPTSQKTIKKYKPTPTSLEYVDRTTYPSFRNDTLPRLTTHQANEAAVEALQTQRAEQEKQKAAQKAVKKAKKTKKPARKQTEAPKPVKTQPEETQVQQAEALQNDPLTQDTTDNGATPAGFLEDGVMGPADFGYNASDPAYQQ